jgi:HD-like signal output (HDOD) protein/CheY-like chemotaxis protein
LPALEIDGQLTGAVTPAGQRVLFVDDEPHLLVALREQLSGSHGGWDVLFVTSGAEALELIAEQPVDAVVSDMWMPEMNGAELLSQVQLLSPSTARIILSGDTEMTSLVSVVRSAQQFLAKPCDLATLTGTLERALRVQRSMADPALRELIGSVATLPALPAVYNELVTEMSSDDVDLASIARILSSDVATSTELLKLVNSAFFGLPRQVYSVDVAVTMLGLSNIQALVLAGSVFRVNDALSWVVDVEQMRIHALRRSAIGRAIADLEGWSTPEGDIAMLSGLLRDVGGLVLAEGMPTAAAGLTEALAAEESPVLPIRVAELEQELYGCTSARASAYLLGLWGFTPSVVHTVAAHPLIDAGPGTSRFERVLDFAGRRAIDPDAVVVLAVDDYLTAERLNAWNAAADHVIDAEGGR